MASIQMFFVFLTGEQDQMIDLKWARLTEQAIKRLGFKQYSFREYKKMAHSSCERVSGNKNNESIHF